MPEPDKIVNFDSVLTIDETKDGCIVEQNAGYQLLGIKQATLSEGGVVVLVNQAAFVADLDFLPELQFIEPGPDNPQTIKTQKAAQGWKFLCSGAIYVQGQTRNVMVFAK